MGDHGFGDRILRLICRAGAYETLRLFARHDGVVSFAQIADLCIRDPDTLVRTLAVEHIITTPDVGTLDAPGRNARFELTALGYFLIAQLDRIDEWDRECVRAAGNARSRIWQYLLRQRPADETP